MKYFLDFEFVEGCQTENFPISLFRKTTKPTIDLISIAIVNEDGRQYYAISKDFNLKEAWNRFQYEKDNSVGARIGCLPDFQKIYWIRDNVLKPIWREMFLMQECDYALLNNREADRFEKELQSGEHDHLFTFKSFKLLLSKFGYTNEYISSSVLGFIFQTDLDSQIKTHLKSPIEFYGYYCDYDWVVFCWLFGSMNNLPKGFPKYCKDLKQMMDEIQFSKGSIQRISWSEIADRGLKKEDAFNIKLMSSFPKQENEHNALSDAKWNKALFEFIQKL